MVAISYENYVGGPAGQADCTGHAEKRGCSCVTREMAQRETPKKSLIWGGGDKIALVSVQGKV